MSTKSTDSTPHSSTENLTTNPEGSVKSDKDVKEVTHTLQKLTVKDEKSPSHIVVDQQQLMENSQSTSGQSHVLTSHQEVIKEITHGKRSKSLIHQPKPNQDSLKARLTFKVITQMSRLNIMTESLEQIKHQSHRYTINEANSMLSVFTDLWSEFSQTHVEIGETCNDDFFNEPYMNEDCFEQGLKTLMEAKALLNSIIAHLTQPTAQPTQTAEPSLSSRRQLPEISLPKFSGDYSTWTSFRDLFLSLVGQNSEITSVEKMHYLRSSLTGEAAQLIANLPLSSDAFNSGWELLTSRYENKRLLIASQMDKLFNSKIISSKSASDLNSLITTTTESLNALISLGAPVDQWDLVLVHFITRRLDTQTREAWEVKQGSRTTHPTYQQLKEFLTGRARALENMQLNSSQYSQTVKKLSSNSSTTQKSAQALTVSHQDYGFACSCCQQSHFIVVCEKFRKLTQQERREFVKTQRLCYNCLGKHSAHACQSDKRCRECNGKHHTMIHITDSKASTKQAQGNTHFNIRPIVLLATSQALLLLNFGISHPVRILLDSGSELSFISEQLVAKLNLPRQYSNIPIVGIGGTASGTTRGMVSIKLQSTHSDQILLLNAYILSKLSSTLPSISLNAQSIPEFKNLQLADPHYFHSSRIDIIIGADHYGQLLEPGLIHGVDSSLTAQKTFFGWVILGPVKATSTKPSHSYHLSVNQQLNDLSDLLSKFWEQEEVPFKVKDSLTPQEQDQLGDSLVTAQRCLRSTLKRISKNQVYGDLYHAFLTEYEKDTHMIRASLSDQSSPVYYLPHHGVLREQSTSTKLRVVFNGSSSSSSGYSLNDILHTGAKLQRDISDVLLWTRKFRYIFSTDITKMFRQVKVHHLDWNLQRILWIDDNNQEVPYQLTTVSYGTKSAPFLAVRVILQLIQDEGDKYPLAVPVLINGRYVDDIYGGADQLKDLIPIAQQTKDLLNRGGFPLAKWQSNHPDLVNTISPGQTSSQTHLFENNITKILGLSWCTQSDCFKFIFQLPSQSSEPITKRIILSEVAQVFDPLGFLSPFIIRAKMLLQELWLAKLGWDDSIPDEITKKWFKFKGELAQLSSISIPRWLNLTTSSIVELHGFSDASQLAMSAVIFIKTTNPGLEPTINLICAKTKVASLKRITIPRLELTAAQLLTRLMVYTQKTLDFSQVPVFMWTDSQVTLNWIQSHPSRWKDYVRNRVSFIQEQLPHAQWRFIKGKENPADCASRGLAISQLKEHALWWNGPPWLKNSSDQWTSPTVKQSNSAQVEERPGLSLMVAANPQSQLWDLIGRYSSLNKLLRITSICSRVIKTLKQTPQSSLVYPLTPGDLNSSLLYWVRAIQGAYFSTELNTLTLGQKLAKSHPLTRLTAYIDNHGILRVGGRLKRSNLDVDYVNSMILPKDSTLTQLIILEAHKRTLHGGTQLTLSHTRKRFWIIGGRHSIKSLVLKCVTCARQRGQRAQQLMGQLPLSRITPTRAFLNTGVDYAGPVSIKAWKGRGATSQKGWICIFVCFSTSAIHLEAVTDNSTEKFIAAFKRFTGRRGICKTLYSDCGKNFKGADAELKRMFQSGTKQFQKLSHLFANDGTTWIFNPPASPHMGGKWEAGVKSVKYHLRRTIGETTLSFEEFTTFLVQIEAILNSRPMEPLSDDPDDFSVLTPGHFLIGEPLFTIPEPSLIDLTLSPTQRSKLITQKLQFFWSKWSSMYLQRQQSISKWHYPSNDIKVGSLVLLTDERFPPAKWPLARVLKLHPGKDGLTRVVTIKTATSRYQRPIHKLAILPIPTEDSSLEEESP
ncbi:uncharacterized protein LOC127278229 [Leptopilina boulardi]|uniref:uncharacterized protein LOC127278229 n=1 Tax=Leptopilina boulardi TaxID=63433 RepID=UPI0021F6996A|nr:uncharacterized protein LOC127278229 [Leptopilina boulardi]